MTYKLFKRKCYSHPEYLWLQASSIDDLFAKYIEAVKRYGNDGFEEWKERITKEFKEAQDDFFVTGYGRLFHRLQVIDESLKEKYMADSGAICPHCDSSDLETAQPLEWTATNTAQETQRCGNCGREWVDYYTLTDVEFTEETNTITVEFEISDQQLSDLMVTALEGGINDWCSGCDVVEPDKNLRPSDAVLEEKWCLSFTDSDPMIVVLLDKEGLLEGVKKTMKWGNFATVEELMDNHDAETADVMIQFALFNEIVYG